MVELVENKDGLLLRSEQSYKEAEEGVANFLSYSHIPELKSKACLPENEIAEIEQRGMGERPDDSELNVHEDVIYATWDKRALVMDLYTPKIKPQLCPTILIVHGGGWASGSHRTYRNFAIKIAKRGYSTVCVEYRLAGEAKYPFAIYDIKAAVRFLRAHSKEFDIDTTQLGIAGASAGGKLAALVALTNGQTHYEGKANDIEQDSSLDFLIVMDGGLSSRANGVWLNDSKDQEIIKETTPFNHVVNNKSIPPMLLINDGPKTYDWIRANQKKVFVKHRSTPLPHAYELLDGEHETVIGWLDEFLKEIAKIE